MSGGSSAGWRFEPLDQRQSQRQQANECPHGLQLGSASAEVTRMAEDRMVKVQPSVQVKDSLDSGARGIRNTAA